MSFKTSYRVFYEDTDAAGVVYHANYLKFAERARTEWLNFLGFSQHELMLKEKVVFPVYELSIKYLKPAFLDNILEVVVDLIEVKNVTMKFSQKIFHKKELLATLEVSIACCDINKKLIKFPEEIKKVFNNCIKL